jgi:hypothetical protein
MVRTTWGPLVAAGRVEGGDSWAYPCRGGACGPHECDLRAEGRTRRVGGARGSRRRRWMVGVSRSSRAAAAQVRVPAGRVTTRRESETRTRRDENETRTRRSEKRETRREQVGGSSEYIASPKAPGVDLAYFQ